MKRIISKVAFPLSFVILAAGIASYVIARAQGGFKAQKSVAPAKQTPRTGYTLVQQRTTTLTVNNKTVTKIDTVIARYVSSDGNFVETKEAKGKKSLAFSRDGKYLRREEDKTGRGGGHLIEIGKYDTSPIVDEDGLQKSPYLRKNQPVEWVNGVKCYVTQRVEGEVTMDIYFAPSLAAVLQIIRTHRRANVVEALKPVTLVFGEPDRKIFEDLPVNLPVKPFTGEHKKPITLGGD